VSKVRQLVQLSHHVELVKSHWRLVKLSVSDIVKSKFFIISPIAQVWVEFRLAFPNLILFIENPDAMIFPIIRYTICQVYNILISFRLQVKLPIDCEWIDSYLKQKSSRKHYNIRLRILYSLTENRLDVLSFIVLIILK